MTHKSLLTLLAAGAALLLTLTACAFLENSPLAEPPGAEPPASAATAMPANAGDGATAGNSAAAEPTAAPTAAAPATAPPAGDANAPATATPLPTTAASSGGGGTGPGGVMQWREPPPRIIDPAASYTAVINTTEGSITVELLTEDAPATVNDFVFLAREGFYDNVIFHRAIEGFMIQGGDPTGTGAGGPGYRFDDEPVQRPYTRGIMAMANAGPNTNGSQFFLMHADYALPPNYTIFGQATSGLETIDAIATAPKKPGGEGSSPVSPAVIQSVEIIGP